MLKTSISSRIVNIIKRVHTAGLTQSTLFCDHLPSENIDWLDVYECLELNGHMGGWV